MIAMLKVNVKCQKGKRKKPRLQQKAKLINTVQVPYSSLLRSAGTERPLSSSEFQFKHLNKFTQC